MQNFPNSPASLHPGFTNRSGSMVGSPYPPHSGDPQISPRSIEEYAAMQQQAQANPQSHGQGHLLHRGQQHPGHAAHMHGYGSRSRPTGEVPQSSPHSGANSHPYRKDMEYYFSVSGRDRSRRGGMAYGTGFGFSNMDGHMPHQYRHAVGSGSSSGMMSPYPLDYATSAGSGGSGSSSSGAGSFSPSQQYSMGQAPSMQPVSASPMHQRQHSQKYPSHQALHPGQSHRSYALHSHRMPPQFSHYPSGSAGMYNSPPHRYDGSGSAAVDIKVNSSPTHSNPATANSTGPSDSMGQPYPASHPPYSPQSHSIHKHAGLNQRNTQHGLATGYEPSIKMQPHTAQASHAYSKHSQSSVPLASPAMPQLTPQEVSKSPMNSQTQPAHMQQNFSPISNPSPAASAVQSPSCSSSSSPLMGVSEGSGNASAPPVQPPSQSSISNPRSSSHSHSHGRLLQTVPQLSPTPHSNSSISSCGSSIGGKGSHPAMNTGRSGVGSKTALAAGREEGPPTIYPACPQEKIMQDPGLNSLNALTSQVANLPNTVQHMMLTDSLLSSKRGKDGVQYPNVQSSSQVVPSSQLKTQGALGHGPGKEDGGATGSDGSSSERTVAEDLSSRPERVVEAKEEQMEHYSDSEPKRLRQMSGTSNESEPNNYYPPKSHKEQSTSQPQNPPEQICRRLPLRVDTEVSKKQSSTQYSSVAGPQMKTPDTQTPSSSSPPSIPPSAQPSPNLPHCLPPSSITSSSTPSPAHSSLSNCYLESDPANADSKNGVRERESSEIKMERNTKTESEETNKKWENLHRGDHRGLSDGDVSKKLQSIDNCKEEMLSPKQNENKDGRPDKGQNYLPDRTLNAAEPQHGGVGVIVSTRPDCNQPEMSKHPESTLLSPQYGGPLHSSQQNYPEDRKFLRDSRSHNGDGDGPVDQYPGQYDTSSKPDFGQMAPHMGPYKYGNDMSYNTCMGMKNRGRMGPAAGMAGNVRYQGYNQTQSTYGSVPRKNSGIMALDAQVRRAMGLGPRPEDNNSQMQQPYPSLLQEVLQGYHLDRRYGRPEQLNAHLQSPNMAQHPYHPRLPYGMIEGMKAHGVSSPALMGVHHAEMTPGKPHPLNQVQNTGNDLGPGVSHSTWDPEAQRLKGSHCGAIDQKSRIGASPNQSSHMQQPTDPQLIAGPPPKHINLADYSLPQRKSSSLTSPPSAVQQLLLQEVEPLAGSVTPTNQTQSASLLSPSSERRSVICDVSPSRRTPEQESQFGTPAASVIQQTFTSATAQEQDNRKDQSGDKKEVKTEDSVTTSEAPNQSGEDLSDDATKKKGKSAVPSADTHSNHNRTSGSSIDLATTTRHHPHPPAHHSIQNPLMSPQKQQPCPQGLDVSGSLASAYTSYPYGDVREGSAELSKVHNPSYHGYGVTSSQSQLSNKSEGYPHPLSLQHAHDDDARLDWAGNTNRPSEMLMTNSDLHASQNQPERKMMSPTDGLTNSSQLPRQQPQYPGTYYDMKMWEAFAARESAGGILEGDTSTRVQQPAPVAPPEPVSAQPTVGSIHPETKSPRAVMEETGKSLLPLPASNSVSNAAGNTTSAVGNQGTSQGRPFRTGASGEPNPLMMRRRVRSFISPIPAKRLYQDGTQKTGSSSYQSPHADPRYHNENESDGARPRLPSPNSCPTPNSQSPPSQGKTKVLPPRKGRGLKLEAIVQKITPSTKKGGDYNSHGDSDSNYPDTEPYCSEDQDIGARFSSGDSCLPYLGDGQSLDEVLAYRGMDDTGPPPIIPYDSLKESSTGSSIGGALRGLQSDFDFGLGTSATPASLVGESDKDDLRIPSDFTLLGPLPPPPPLPRPVQGSPPPSSSALSDIQQFTNTYQQLETRRGEQSAANLLRQKLQETGMGFDEYSSGDYYGTSPGQGHHLLSRSQHQVSSPRSGMSMSDSKPAENIVPKGYFPSGKKKGRPVGSVNKQKRAQQQQQQQQQQTQQQNVVPSSTTTSQASSPAAASSVPQPASSVGATAEVPATLTASPENQAPSAAVTQPAQPAIVKVDIEGEETQTEVAAKSGRHRQRKAKEDSEDGVPTSRQRRRRRAVPVTSKEEPDTTNTGANAVGIFQDKQNNGFAPYIHVERKIAELGAVCTIVNAEEEKLKSGKGSGGGSSSDTLSSLAQMVKRDKDIARVKENRVSEQVTSALQSGKVLPASGYVLPGPVVSETAHTGRLLCCLCQKWANYKHLGDLYGPFYPSEYAAKLPKNQPQVKQILSHPGSSTAGTSVIPNSADTNDTQLLDSVNVKSSTDSDCTASHATNPTSPATTVGTASPAAGEEMPSLSYKTASATINRKVHNWELTHEKLTVTEPQKPPELQNEVTGEPKPQSQHQQPDDAQQWPQHRKLTSHPRFKRRHKSGEDLPRTIPSNNKASLPFQPPPPSLDSLGPLAQLAQLPQVPLDPEELWVHEGCITWASGVFLVSGKLYGLEETLEGARETNCSHCEMVGATLGCHSKGCTLRYHYICGIEADCSMNEENFSLRCPKHKASYDGEGLHCLYKELERMVYG